MARVGILILNYNGEKHLRKFLPSVIANSTGCNIIVGDNCSTDNSIQLLETTFPDIQIIKLAENYGYAEGYNQLIKQTTNEYLVLVNSDVEVTENWLEGLISILDSDKQVAAVQPKILSYNNKELFEYAGAAGGYIDKYGYPFCRGRVFNTIEEDLGQYNDNRPIFWASGACFMVKKSVFDKLGGFDSMFFAHMEEIDLNWRMYNQGYKVMYCSESVVYHLGGGTLSYDSPRKTYLNFRNGYSMLIKNLSGSSRLRILFIRWWLDMLSVFYFLFQFKLKSSLAILQAHFYIITHFRRISSKKAQTIAPERFDPVVAPKNFSLVNEYFIKNKRRFSQLIPD